MSEYREVRTTKHEHKKHARELDHIRVRATEHGDGHLVEHVHSDGSVKHFEFRHPEENSKTITHLREHLGMESNSEEENGKAKQPMTNIPAARKVAGVAEARHVVPNISPHADQRKIAAERNAQHNRDMARINELANRGKK